ncbi:uncharacterized protein SCHCODRAFT_02669399 [Schizophyllum commune H4-8]|nr:uncharacterized protein SCHCODRAFT_02669399 [Schizophyllum commune H4-8]KAI5890217.1 hypothetical protein SCHCODRAFT_02669399 [Schizophyllum commune H4-8]
MVVQNLGTPWQRVVLSVCRSLHDIALRCLFSSIKVYFFTEDLAKDLTNNTERYEILEALATRSYELLERCCVDPTFASIVRDLTVVEYMERSTLGVFEKKTLTRALKATQSLRTLTFIPHGVLDTVRLCEYIPPSVENLTLPYAHCPDALYSTIEYVKSYTNVLLVPYVGENGTDVNEIIGSSWGWVDNIPFNHLEFADNIRHVTSRAEEFKDIPIRILDQLVSLELCFDTCTNWSRAPDLAFILRHATVLQDLRLSADVRPTVMHALPDYSADPRCVPSLRSFAVHTVPCRFIFATFKEKHMGYITRFLSGRATLTRLFLGIDNIPNKRSWLPRVLPDLLRSLPALRVLGLGEIALRQDGWERVADALPLELEALAVCWGTRHQDPENPLNDVSTFELPYLHPMLDRLEHMPRLAFLHLFCKDSTIKFDPEQLVQSLPALRTLALRRSVWDVERVQALEDYPTGESDAIFAEGVLSPTVIRTALAPVIREAELPTEAEVTPTGEGTELHGMPPQTRDSPYAILVKWNPWKVRAFGEADFSSSDHAWLFRMSILAIYTV